MFDIDEIELRRLDLTVLLVFLNLLRFRKATDVAAHMGLTQSSISHSLKRLREVFGDPLFLRTPRGMDPTSVALALEPQIRSVVETLSQVVTTPARFDPATSDETIRIGAYDNEMTSLVPGLLQHILMYAPNMRMSLMQLGRRPALEALENREIDLALGLFWEFPSSFRKTDLYEESYSVVFRKEHKLASGTHDLKSYCACDHLIVSPRGDLTGIVDEELAKLGEARRIVVAMPQFLPALATVAESDLVATLPRRLAMSQAKRYGLVAAPPPFQIRPFQVSAIHHERDANNPMLDWILSALNSVSANSA